MLRTDHGPGIVHPKHSPRILQATRNVRGVKLPKRSNPPPCPRQGIGHCHKQIDMSSSRSQLFNHAQASNDECRAQEIGGAQIAC